MQEPCFLFLHPLHRVFSCPLRQTRSGFFRQAFCLSLPFFHAQEIDRLGSEIPLSTLVAVDRLSSFGNVRRRCTKALRKQPMPARNRILRVETDELERTLGGTAISSSLDRALPSLRHRALPDKWPEIGDISSKGHGFVSIDEKRSVSSKARPTMLAFSSNSGYFVGENTPQLSRRSIEVLPLGSDFAYRLGTSPTRPRKAGVPSGRSHFVPEAAGNLAARTLISGESDATDRMWAKATNSAAAKVTETPLHDRSQSSIAVQETQTAGVSGDTITRDLPNTNNTGERRSDHCPLCNANFRDQSQLWRHINLEHIPRRIFPPVDFLVAHGRRLCSEPFCSFSYTDR